MKKIVICTICLLMVFIVIIKSADNTLNFENSEYSVYMPTGAPANEWEKIDEYYSTAYCGFSVAFTILQQNNLDEFESYFISCYDKFSSNNDVYAIMDSVFLCDNTKYSKNQFELLSGLLEKIYNTEMNKKHPNNFLLEKNIMLRVELNYKNGKLFDALALKKLLED